MHWVGLLPGPTFLWHRSLTSFPGLWGQSQLPADAGEYRKDGQAACWGRLCAQRTFCATGPWARPAQCISHFLCPWRGRAAGPALSCISAQLTTVATPNPHKALETEVSNINANVLRGPVGAGRSSLQHRPGTGADTGPEEIRGFWDPLPPPPLPPALATP